MMKTILFAFLFSGSVILGAHAQDIKEKEVPQAVTSALAQKYAGATNAEWEKEGDNYEAEFRVERTEHTVLLNPSGEVLVAKSDVPLNDLPQPIKSALDQKYKGMPVDDTEQLEKEGKTFYQLEVEENGTDRRLVFSADGQEVTVPAYWD
ncbi:hypothetical protein GCM10023188_25260 [Pontibacter saemangeumensis]|uniref:Putative beta-lactamase-inhibitor-like PepSY-like domain-containing protein n=1 Tax=Pontibacter saemangeumensis TaxID=1084525 RepID=A0ABP8LSU2_9BACT